MGIMTSKIEQLIEVLAKGNMHAIKKLCDEWGVIPSIVYPVDGSRSYYNVLETVARLAQEAQSEI